MKKQEQNYKIIKIPLDKKELKKSKYYIYGFENYEYDSNDEYLFLLWLCSYCPHKNYCNKNLYERLLCVNNAVKGKYENTKTSKKLINDIFDKELEKSKIKKNLYPIY